MHRSLAPKPGVRPRDIVVRFHYCDSKEALTLPTRNRTHTEYKGDKIEIFSDLSPITLAKRRNLRPITAHLQSHRIPYYWGFPFRLSVMKDETQHVLQDLHEGEAFLKGLSLQPLSAEDLLPPPSMAPSALSRLWTPAKGTTKKVSSTPQCSITQCSSRNRFPT